MLLAALLVACATTESTADTAGSTAPSTTPTTPTTTVAADLTAWVAEVEGAWSGAADPTPVGPVPFALAFAFEGDGSLVGIADGYGMTLSFRYHQDEAGWHLTEEGTLPGGYVQAYTLEPTSVEDGRVEWAYAEDPEYLRVVEVHEADRWVLEAYVRGELHAVLDLGR